MHHPDLLTPLPLQKWLMRARVGSKNQVRAWISDGRVTVNDTPTRRFAEPVPHNARVALDGVTLQANPDQRIVLLMHKPKKHLTALDDRGDQPGLRRYLPPDHPHLFPVGRLDFNTTGALLWTNDGHLARRVLHPSGAFPKLYHVKIRGHLSPDDPRFDRIRAGLSVGKATYRPIDVALGPQRTRATWVYLTLYEGQFRQIRKICAHLRFQIVKLHRAAIGPITLGDLNPRCVRPLSSDEVHTLDLALDASHDAASPDAV